MKIIMAMAAHIGDGEVKSGRGLSYTSDGEDVYCPTVVLECDSKEDALKKVTRLVEGVWEMATEALPGKDST